MSVGRVSKRALLNAAALSLPLFVLAACGQNTSQTSASGAADSANLALPLTADASAPAPAPAPVAAALPRAARIRVATVRDPRDAYAYADQAYAMDNAYGQAPPDYEVYGDDGSAPLVWRGDTGAIRIVEAVPGGYRIYYYQAGDDWPFYIQDSGYGYGYSGGALVGVYDGRQHLRRLGPDDPALDLAARLMARAVELRQSALNGQRRPARVADWRSLGPRLHALDDRYVADRNSNSDWRAYHDEHDAEQNAYWQGEQTRRQSDAQAYQAWGGNNYQGPPPARSSGVLPAAAAGAVAGGVIGAIIGNHHHDQAPPQPAAVGRVNTPLPAPQAPPARTAASPAPEAFHGADNGPAIPRTHVQNVPSPQNPAIAERQAQAELQARQAASAAAAARAQAVQAQANQARAAQASQAEAQAQAQSAARARAAAEQATAAEARAKAQAAAAHAVVAAHPPAPAHQADPAHPAGPVHPAGEPRPGRPEPR